MPGMKPIQWVACLGRSSFPPMQQARNEAHTPHVHIASLEAHSHRRTAGPAGGSRTVPSFDNLKKKFHLLSFDLFFNFSYLLSLSLELL
jgi:hypothetical protein